MKALTIRQPWAQLIAVGAKTIETRSWPTGYRGDLLIHAGKAKPGDDLVGGFWVMDTFMIGLKSCDAIHLPLGAVVAVARLADVVPIFAPYMGTGPLVVVHGREAYLHRNGTVEDVSEQVPLGDFTPYGRDAARFAWLLDDVRPLDPIPAKGRQGLWTPDADLLALVADQ